MSIVKPVYQQMIDRLASRHPLGDAEREAVRALPIELRQYDPSSHLVREGQRPVRCAFLIDGYTFRQKLTVTGNRAVCSLQVPGDFVDLQNIYLNESDHDAQTLTAVTAAEIALPDLWALVDRHPAIGRAFWIDGLVEASIYREWLLNVGRRSARARIAHLLCEISARLRFMGVAADASYDLPMTQEQLGDALGLTAVHVNRVLKGLEADRLIQRQKRKVTITDWQTMRRVAEFSERYLHFDQGGE